MVKVEAELDRNVTDLEKMGKNVYSGSMISQQEKTDGTVIKKVTIRAVGDNGEITEQTEDLYISQNDFELRMIAAKPSGEEIGYLDARIDIDIGETMDFEVEIPLDKQYEYQSRIFIPRTEYGGLLEDLEVRTKSKKAVWRGKTWRGLLTQKIIEPPEGESHLILNGELSVVTQELVGRCYSSLFIVDLENTGVQVSGWKVDRYVTLYDALMKLFGYYGYRLQIEYVEPENLEYGYVKLKPVPVTDWSDEVEYSQDSKVNFTIRDCRNGINHLVCIGKGENEERTILHLYAQKDGSIGKTQSYFGFDERTAVYEYSSADPEKLEEGGVKRLKELKNYKQIDVWISDVDLELGDIISGYENVTGTSIKKPITNKILKIQNGTVEIEYEVKGDD